jgi:iron complex transport system permease protein
MAPAVGQSRGANQLVVGGLAVALGVTVIVSLCVGRYPIPLATVFRVLLESVTGVSGTHSSWSVTDGIVVMTVRLPRILVAALAGAGLGLGGAALQGLFRNPLVGPQVVGISNGAAFGGVVAILLGLGAGGTVTLAFVFAALSLAAVFVLSRLSGAGNVLSVVLAGVIVSAFFAALVGLAEFFADAERQLPGLVYWLLGSFASVSKRSVAIIAVPTVSAGVMLLLLRWRINILSLGDADARALGVDVERLRWIVLALVTLLVAAQVAVSGAIGWVGLVVPHLARRLVGPNHTHLLPASALIGAVYLLVVDDIARTLATQELPVGVLTALIGAPIFALVFWRSQARGFTRD